MARLSVGRLARLCVAAAICLLVGALPAGAGRVGVNYGLMGPYRRSTVANLRQLKRSGVSVLKTFKVDRAWLSAVKSVYGPRGALVTVGIENSELDMLLSQRAFQQRLIRTLRRNQGLIKYISVGNEPFHGSRHPRWMAKVVNALRVVDRLLRAKRLRIKPTVAFGATTLVDTYPPRRARFRPVLMRPMLRIFRILRRHNSVFCINLYPYLAFLYDSNVSLGFARSGRLLDAQIKATRAALRKAGAGSLELMIGETGWPTGGGPGASRQNAKRYTSNVVRMAKRSKRVKAVYFFEAFDEAHKRGSSIDIHWGLFTANAVAKTSLRLN